MYRSGNMSFLLGHVGKVSARVVFALSLAAWLGLCYWAISHRSALFPDSQQVSAVNTRDQPVVDGESANFGLSEPEMSDPNVSDAGMSDTGSSDEVDRQTQPGPDASADDALVAELVLLPTDAGNEPGAVAEEGVSSDVSVTDSPRKWSVPELLIADDNSGEYGIGNSPLTAATLPGPVPGRLQNRIWTEGWQLGEDLFFATADVESDKASVAGSLIDEPLIAVIPAIAVSAAGPPAAGSPAAGSPAAESPAAGSPAVDASAVEESKKTINRKPVNILTAIASRVRFPKSGARPDEATTQALDRLYEHLFIYSDSAVKIVVSSHEYDNAIEDRNLSRKRGGAIVRYLVDRGLPEARFMVGIESGLQLPSDAQRVKVTLGARN